MVYYQLASEFASFLEMQKSLSEHVQFAKHILHLE
jgi:hypothetical protein